MSKRRPRKALSEIIRSGELCELISRNPEKTERLLNDVIKCGRLDMFIWLYENGCKLNEVTSIDAARYGHINILEWLRDNDTENLKTENTTGAAAEGGHLDVLIWLLENGWPWDGDVFAAAMETGQIEIVKWAHENGCPMDWRMCQEAETCNYPEILQWIDSIDCPCGKNTHRS